MTPEFEQWHAEVEFLHAALLAEAKRVGGRVNDTLYEDDLASDLVGWMAVVDKVVTDCHLSAIASGRIEPWRPILDAVGEAFACDDKRPHHHVDGLRGPYRTCVDPAPLPVPAPLPPPACYQRDGFMVHHAATCQCVRRPSR